MISIKRESAKGDRLRNYKVEIDGAVIGEIGDGQTKSFNIEPGPHTLRLKIDWGSSRKVNFKSTKGKTVHFRCVTSLTGLKVWAAIVYATILFHRYIELERVD